MGGVTAWACVHFVHHAYVCFHLSEIFFRPLFLGGGGGYLKRKKKQHPKRPRLLFRSRRDGAALRSIHRSGCQCRSNKRRRKIKKKEKKERGSSKISLCANGGGGVVGGAGPGGGGGRGDCRGQRTDIWSGPGPEKT